MKVARAAWFASVLLLGWSAPAGAVVCVSPGGGLNYGLTDLAASCPDLTGAGGQFTSMDDVIVLPIDSLTLAPGETLEFAPTFGLEVQGTLNVVASENPVTLRGIGAGTWAGLQIEDGATGSLQGLQIENAQTGIVVGNVAAAVWSGVHVTGSAGDGFFFDGTGGDISLFQCEADSNGGAGFRFQNTRRGPSLQETAATFNQTGVRLTDVGPDGQLRDSQVDDNLGVGVTFDSGASRFEISGGSLERNVGGAIVADGTGTVAADALRVRNVTITESGDTAIDLSGSAGLELASLAIADGTAGDGVVLDNVWGADVSFNTIERNAADGINVLGGRPARYATVVDDAPVWVDVDAGTADGWTTTGDASTLGPIALPFTFELGGESYTQAVQHADGVVELLTETDTPSPLPAGQGWAPIAHAYPGRVFLFAQTDDWCTDCDPAFDPGAAFAGFGYDHLQAGQFDASGNAVSEDTVAFVWKTQSTADVGSSTGRNDFAVHIHPDGTMRWSIGTMELERAPRGVFSGALLPDGELLVGSRYQLTATSFRFDPSDPANPLAEPTTINGNVIRENLDSGIQASACQKLRIWDNGLAGNRVGITHSGGSSQTRLVYNNIAGNGDPVGSTELENVQMQALVARDNWWGVTGASAIDARIIDDDENVLYQPVEFTPWREGPIQPGPPGPIHGLTGEPLDGGVRLHWDASDAPDLNGYQVRWGTQTGQWGSVVDLTGTDTNHELTGLTNGTAYYITVAALDLAGNVGTAAGEIEVVPQQDPPPPKGFFEGGGCNCSLTRAPHRSGSPLAMALIALAALLTLRRRR